MKARTIILYNDQEDLEQVSPFLLLIGVWYLAIVLWFIRRGIFIGSGPLWKAARRHGVVCGRCGYAIDPSRMKKCSECGSLLDSVGVATPRVMMAFAPSLLAVGVAIAPLFLIVGMLLHSGVSRLTNQVRWGAWEAQSVQISARATPWRTIDRANPQRRSDGSLSYYPAPGYSFSIQFSGIVPAGATDRRPRSGEITIGLHGDAIQDHVLKYSIQQQAWTMTDTQGAVVVQGSDLSVGIKTLFHATSVPQQAQFFPEELEDALRIGNLALQSAEFHRLWQPRMSDDAGFAGLASGPNSQATGSEPRGLRRFSSTSSGSSTYATRGLDNTFLATIALTSLMYCLTLWSIFLARRKLLSQYTGHCLPERANGTPSGDER